MCTQEKHSLEGSVRYSVPCICWGSWAVSSKDKGEGCFFKFFYLFYYFILSICLGGVHSCHCVHMEVRGQLWEPVLPFSREFQGANSGHGTCTTSALTCSAIFPCILIEMSAEDFILSFVTFALL